MTKVRLPFPLTQKAYLLHSLLNQEAINEQECKMNSFRARISDLRDDGVDIKNRWIPFLNRCFKKSRYMEHFLLKEEEENAILIYNRINTK